MKSIVGKLIGDRFFVLQELKQERSTALYLAQDRTNPESPSCQVERLHFASPQNNDSDFQTWQNLAKLFQAEAIALKQLGKQPQIPRIIDYFIEDRDYYLISELCDGKTLKQCVTKKLLTETEAIFWLESTLEVLDFIHQKHILHLNIKPENLIQPQPNEPIILTNFGNIRNSLESFYYERQTLFASQGDDEYIPPEQREGSANPKSDLYALGKSIVYALTGEVPKLKNTSSSNYQKPLLAAMSDRARVNISYKLNRILSKMIEEDRTARYQSAAEVMTELRQNENIVALPLPYTVLSQQDSSIRLKQPPKSKTKIRNRNWFWMLLGLPFLAAAIVFFVGIERNLYRNFVAYSNDNYDLTLKYPQDWTLRESEDPITGEIVVFTSPLSDLSDWYRERVYVSVEYLTLGSMTLDEYVREIVERLESEGNQIEDSPSKTQLDGERAITIVYSRTEDGLRLKQQETFTIIDNRVYIVTYVAEADRYERYLKTVGKMQKSLDIESEI